jgi:prepilin-type N-terminal cleavage/methylation domain-containing protein
VISRGKQASKLEIADCKNKKIKGEKMTKNKKGFTIIEVVLVLAIAGLIFLMVFIALPALQRSQRNTQRKDDMSRIMTAVTDFMGNNSGKSPWVANKESDFKTKYIKANGGDAQFRDPDGTAYSFSYKLNEDKKNDKVVSGTNVDHVIYTYGNAVCGELENSLKKGSGASNIAMFYIMEGGQVLCTDNT